MRTSLFFIISILLLAPTVQSQNLVEEFTMTFSSPQYFDTPILESGTEYYLKISGTYGIANWTAHRDAAFELSNQQPTGNDAHWLWNGEFDARPYPDVYNDNHIYFYYFTSNGTSEVFEYYDSAYGDNSGSLTFQLWQIVEEDIYGCTDSLANNFNPEATLDDGSCLFTGCMDYTACNYDSNATTDDGSCTYVDSTPIPSGCGGGATAPACGLFFSGYAEGSSNNKFLEIYNPTDADISLSGFAYPSVSNAPSVPGEYEYWNAFDEGAVVAAGDVYIIAHGSADPAILAEADEFHTYLSNGDDGYALVEGDESSYVIVDMIGTWDADPGSGWEVAGVANGTKDHSLIRKSDVINGNGGDWYDSAGTDVDNSEWIVYDQNDWTGLGDHEFSGYCEAVSEVVFYDCDGNCLLDSDGDGVCNELEIAGCMDYTALNFCSEATDENGSCEWSGCGDYDACNYYGATFDDGSCWYPDYECYDCDGNCISDFNLNGICDCNEVLGCTYVFSCNYDPSANVDDGSCESETCAGCTYNTAINYNPEATDDDGSCIYEELDLDAVFDLGFTEGVESVICPEISNCPADLDEDGIVGLSDLLVFLSSYGTVCEVTDTPWMCGDDIGHEGYDYSTVLIGDQCWFSENCRYLPEVSPSSEGSTTDPYCYVYDYQGTDVTVAKSTENYDTYGVLYNWPAVITEGICPSGWHVPSDEEFTELTDFLGGEEVAGYAMKSTSGWNSDSNGSNSSGFNGLPGGILYSDIFHDNGSYGYWWTSSEFGSGAWVRFLHSADAGRDFYERYFGLSARCIKD